MAKLSDTDFAESVRAIGITQAEATEILLGLGYSASSAQSMSKGKTGVPRDVQDTLASLWAQVDGTAPVTSPLASIKRRREIIKTMRDRHRYERPVGIHFDLHERVPARAKGTPEEELEELISLGWKPVDLKDGDL